MQEQEYAPFVLAHLQCGCTVMQCREENTGLFFLLQKVSSGRVVTLFCPQHNRQQVERLITRTHRRAHWPLIEKTTCSHCQHDVLVPQPPAEGDEQTMPHNAHGRDGVYVRCPLCHRWGNYGFIGTAEDRYDMRWVRETCPNCHQTTVVSYDPFTTKPGETIPFRCVECRKPFHLVFQPRQAE